MRYLKTIAVNAEMVITTMAVPSSAHLGHKDIQSLHDAMRKLWEDHITWTRLFIVDAAADLPEKGKTTDRLLRNQTDIGNAVKPYFSDAAGNKLTDLLRSHILIAAD